MQDRTQSLGLDLEEVLSPEVRSVIKAKCLSSIMFQTRYFFKKQYGRKFVQGEHHIKICRALELVYCGWLKRLKINIAPRYGKTELAVKSFISGGLSLNESAKFIHLSYGDDIAIDNSESIKDLIEMKDFQEIFPELRLKADSKAKNKWYTTAKGGILARAAGGQVTGFGAGQVQDEDEWLAELEKGVDEAPLALMEEYINTGKFPEGHELDMSLERKLKFAGAVVIDDPIKPEDADMDTLREKVNSRFDSTIRNRTNSRHTPIIIIMQRLHPNDLCGYLDREEESDEWLTLSLPCIKPDGTALWPFKETIEELQKQKKANELVFMRQKQQDPRPKTGLMFPHDDLNWYEMTEEMAEKLEDPDFCFIPVDPANKGGDDFAGGSFKLIGDRIYVHEMIYNTLGTDYNEPEVAELAMKNNSGEVGVEGILGWIETANRIRDHLSDKDFQGEFRILRPRTAKPVRIANRQSFIRNNMYFRKDYMKYPQYRRFITNLTEYLKVQEPGKENKHDEAPDLCEMAATYYEQTFPTLWRK